jgi:folylpolyglutamate synthase/dihydropteroate synthase
MALHLAPLAREVIVTAPPGKAAVEPERLAAAFRQSGRRCIVQEQWRDALAAARARCGKRDLLLVTGSVYLVGAVMGELGHAP